MNLQKKKIIENEPNIKIKDRDIIIKSISASKVRKIQIITRRISISSRHK